MGAPAPWMLLQAAALLLLLFTMSAGAEQRTEVGPAVCHPDCNKHGTCGEDGHCRCPFGRLGEACENDFLAPCRQFPDAEALCGVVFLKSCECLKRCREYYCLKDLANREWCHGWPPPPDRPCYKREGVSPDEQYSRMPEPDEKGVKCYKSWSEASSPEIPCSEAAVYNGKEQSVPISQCPDECNKRGHCMKYTDQPADAPAECRCHFGFEGHSCETTEKSCYNDCNGRGKCIGQFCHCEPPYFSIDCSRSKVYPANHSMPSPINFKIYMYELSTQLAYENKMYAGWHHHDQIYVAYQKFLAQFLVSPVRTEDPSEANLFFIPAFIYSYTGNGGDGTDHFHIIIDHIRHKYPWWNRHGGKDHFMWSTTDRGACHLRLEAQNAIKILHFGMYTTPQRHSPTFPHFGTDLYGCTHPLRDVVAAPYDPIGLTWINNTLSLSLEEHLALKKRYLFFAGGILEDQPEYSGNTRQTMYKAIQEWKDPEFEMVKGGVGGEYEGSLRSSYYCLTPYGWGWGNRLLQTMMAGCVPIIVQEYTIQAYEDVLPYEEFSLRLTNEDLPHLREIVKGISKERYRELLEGVRRHLPAFGWDPQAGGKAFDYTIASLRRKYLNFKAMYYDDVYHGEQ